MSDYMNLYMRERAQFLREHGMCTRCGKSKAEEGKRLCGDCAYKRSEYLSLVWSSKTPEEKKALYKKAAEYRAARRQERVANGLCTACGTKLRDARYKMCFECRLRKRRESCKWREKNGAISREQRLSGYYCIRCCKPIVPNGSRLCPECLDYCKKLCEYMRSRLGWRKNIGDQHDYRHSNF